MLAEGAAAADAGGAGAAALDSVFESYAAACRTGAGVDASLDGLYEEGVERVREHLLSSSGDVAACMICLEPLSPADAVWACQGGCYAAMHLPCIQSWARRALAAARDKSEQRLSPALFPAAAAEAKRAAAWGCPKCRCGGKGVRCSAGGPGPCCALQVGTSTRCGAVGSPATATGCCKQCLRLPAPSCLGAGCRTEYSAVPSGYHCWCGKVQDPAWDPWNAAHRWGRTPSYGLGPATAGAACMLEAAARH